MDTFIRTAHSADATSIAQLSNQLGYPASAAETAKRLDLILQDTNNCVFVALADQKVVGWVHGFYAVRIESDPFIEIGGLVIDEHYRRQNIGRSLVEKIAVWSSAKGTMRLRVRCNKVRTETHQFYISLGFTEMKEQKIFEMRLS